MGITITGKFQDAPSYEMGYGAFYRLRRDIAYAVSYEYGMHYEALPFAHLNNVDEYNKKTEKLIRKYHLNERFLSFLYQTDLGGKLSPFKCASLLLKIADMKNDTLYGYVAYPKDCMTIKKFKDLLLECFERRKYLVWY